MHKNALKTVVGALLFNNNFSFCSVVRVTGVNCRNHSFVINSAVNVWTLAINVSTLTVFISGFKLEGNSLFKNTCMERVHEKHKRLIKFFVALGLQILSYSFKDILGLQLGLVHWVVVLELQSYSERTWLRFRKLGVMVAVIG